MLVIGVYLFLKRGQLADEIYGFYNRPRKEGGFAWTDIRIWEPSREACGPLAIVVSAVVMIVGLMFMVDAPTSSSEITADSNVWGCVAGGVLFVTGIVLLLRKNVISARLHTSFPPASAMTSSAVFRLTTATGYVISTAGLITFVLSS